MPSSSPLREPLSTGTSSGHSSFQTLLAGVSADSAGDGPAPAAPVDPKVQNDSLPTGAAQAQAKAGSQKKQLSSPRSLPVAPQQPDTTAQARIPRLKPLLGVESAPSAADRSTAESRDSATRTHVSPKHENKATPAQPGSEQLVSSTLPVVPAQPPQAGGSDQVRMHQLLPDSQSPTNAQLISATAGQPPNQLSTSITPQQRGISAQAGDSRRVAALAGHAAREIAHTTAPTAAQSAAPMAEGLTVPQSMPADATQSAPGTTPPPGFSVPNPSTAVNSHAPAPSASSNVATPKSSASAAIHNTGANQATQQMGQIKNSVTPDGRPSQATGSDQKAHPAAGPTPVTPAMGNAAAHSPSAGSNPTPQHTSSLPAQPSSAPAQQAQSIAQPNAPTAIGGVSHGAEPLPRGSAESVSNGPAAALPKTQPDEMAATSGINTARLIQTMTAAGMRVAVQSPEYGGISVHTTVQQQQMLAQISVDHSGLAGAISAHVPSIESRLNSNLGLRTAIQVTHNGASFSGGNGGSSQGDRGAPAPSSRPDDEAARITARSDNYVRPVTAGRPAINRLDIRV